MQSEWHVCLGKSSQIILAFVASLPSPYPNHEMKNCVCVALVMKFFFDKFNFTSGGALGSLTLGLVIKEIWARGWPAFACNEGKEPLSILSKNK